MSKQTEVTWGCTNIKCLATTKSKIIWSKDFISTDLGIIQKIPCRKCGVKQLVTFYDS